MRPIHDGIYCYLCMCEQERLREILTKATTVNYVSYGIQLGDFLVPLWGN